MTGAVGTGLPHTLHTPLAAAPRDAGEPLARQEGLATRVPIPNYETEHWAPDRPRG